MIHVIYNNYFSTQDKLEEKSPHTELEEFSLYSVGGLASRSVPPPLPQCPPVSRSALGMFTLGWRATDNGRQGILPPPMIYFFVVVTFQQQLQIYSFSNCQVELQKSNGTSSEYGYFQLYLLFVFRILILQHYSLAINSICSCSAYTESIFHILLTSYRYTFRYCLFCSLFCLAAFPVIFHHILLTFNRVIHRSIEMHVWCFWLPDFKICALNLIVNVLWAGVIFTKILKPILCLKNKNHS